MGTWSEIFSSWAFWLWLIGVIRELEYLFRHEFKPDDTKSAFYWEEARLTYDKMVKGTSLETVTKVIVCVLTLFWPIVTLVSIPLYLIRGDLNKPAKRN